MGQFIFLIRTQLKTKSGTIPLQDLAQPLQDVMWNVSEEV